jgi:hypothetical protein
MIRWFLDDTPFGMAVRHCPPTLPWQPASVHIVGAIADALDQDRSKRRRALFECTAAGSPVVVEHRVHGGSEAEAMLWGHLRTSSTQSSRNLAEDEAIALLSREVHDGTLVILDRKAAMVALAELGRGRVASPFDYWDWLRSERVIDEGRFQTLCAATVREDTGLPGTPVRFR